MPFDPLFHKQGEAKEEKRLTHWWQKLDCREIQAVDPDDIPASLANFRLSVSSFARLSQRQWYEQNL
jgi:hypothetical protein